MTAHPRKILDDIEKQDGPGSVKRKRAIVTDHLEVPEFVKTVEYALDPWKQFYVTTIPGLADISKDARGDEKRKKSGHRDLFEDAPAKLTWKEQFSTMFTLLDDLVSRKLPPNSSQARNAVLEWAKKCGPGTIEVFRRILLKDLKCKMGARSFNKIKKDWVPQFEVQLAKPFDEKKLQWPCFVDPKYDGERCLASITFDGQDAEVIYLSRNGNQFFNYGCFDKDLIRLFRPYGCCTVDCEVVHIGGFQKGQQTPSLYRQSFDATGLQLVVFDLMPTDSFNKQKFDLTQEQRYQELTKLFKHFKSDSWDIDGGKSSSLPKLILVSTKLATSYDDALEIYEYWVGKGLEGVILKQPDGLYEFRRSDAWMKLKPKKTADLEVVGMELGDENKLWKGKCGSLVVKRQHNGAWIKVNVASGLTHQMHEDIKQVGDQILYTNPEGHTVDLKGRIIEVVYDAVTDDGSLRFPRIKPRKLELVRSDK